MSEIDYTAPEFVASRRQQLREYFQIFPFFKLMGIELIDVEPGRARLRMNWREDLSQPARIMHGGAIASLVDTAFAHAILLTPTYLEIEARGGQMVTIDLRVKYLRPVSSGRIECEAHVTRLGRQIVHTAATVTDAAGKEVALGDSIYMLIPADQLRKKNG
jgi:uncharacterized protein (TIGR00369 family)